MSSSSSSSSSQESLLFFCFFDCWLAQQDRDLESLYAAISHSQQVQEQHINAHDPDNQTRHLVDQVIGHYEYYFRAKMALAHRDVLPMFTPTWTSSTDNLFIWVGGYRPSIAFHLLYSKSGLQFESQLARHISLVLEARDLGNLSLWQLETIDRLQRATIVMEREISEEEAKAQESVASMQLVDISHKLTEAMRGGDHVQQDGRLVERMMASDMKDGREKMGRVLERADQLRLDTLKRVTQILSPLQAAHFLIAASELFLRVHQYGKSLDLANMVRGHRRARSSEM